MVTRTRTCNVSCHQFTAQFGKLCTANAPFRPSDGEEIDFEEIGPILLYGYDKLYYRKLILHVDDKRWQRKEGILRGRELDSARQAAATMFITGFLSVPCRFREINLVTNIHPQ